MRKMILIGSEPNARPDAASVCQPTSTAQLTAVTPAALRPVGSPANPSAASIDANRNISGLSAAVPTDSFIRSLRADRPVPTRLKSLSWPNPPLPTAALPFAPAKPWI
ncbi:MAG: hypothetical protein U0X91_31115 [Spirosomataceae bacterium]